MLADAVVNKIAAGEVIDRPASVLKELVENSLDAGASSISVRLQGSLGAMIAVSDDGCGLSPDDALLAVERHATSKILRPEDLETVTTLGFRGEALPSIAAVSHFTLETRRREDELGFRLAMAGGRILSAEAAALPSGTAVTVSRLFHNLPVRKKFLRSAATEKGHLVRTFLKLALSAPAVRFTLRLDERDLYCLNAVEDPADRVATVLGREDFARFHRVEESAGGLTLAGFVADPDRPPLGSSSFFFVNGRAVEDRLLLAGLREGLTPGGRGQARTDHILFLTLDPREVDVNVHPTKREVRFTRPREVVRFIAGAVARASGREYRPAPAPSWIPSSAAPRPGQIPPPSVASAPLPYSRPAPPVFPPPHASLGEPGSASGDPAPWRSLGQVLGTYLVLETREGLVLVDQHAAHERVLYERVLGRLRRVEPLGQGLLIAEEWEIPRHLSDRLEKALPVLARLGCTLEASGPETVRVVSLPAEVRTDEIRSFLTALLERFEDEEGTEVTPLDWRERYAALVACHGAVKAQDPLRPDWVPRLLADLLACEDPRHCPHGRPTMVTLGSRDLERLFRR